MLENSKKLVIALDGYSSCGKSTFAKMIAQKLGYLFIDTGAMYRAVALMSIQEGLDNEALRERASDMDIDFIYNKELGRGEVFLNQKNVDSQIRSLEVSNNVSRVAQIAEVREKLVELQRKIGSEGGVVMDGRDIGTVVFPNADIKIFMTADVMVRAKRRYDEMGGEASLEDIAQNIKSRDYQDENRKHSPLSRAKDAIELDNSYMTVVEQMEWFDKIYNNVAQKATPKKVVAIIPARYASTRFPGKPLAKIGGRSMIEWVWRRAAEVFEYRFVATDDKRIAQEVESFGGVAIMTSENHPSGTDRVAEAVSKLPFTPDVVINIQGDEPFVRPEQLKSLIDLFDDDACDIATLVQPFDPKDDIFNPNAVKVVRDKNGYALYFSRSPIPFLRGEEQRDEWAAKHTYFRHIGLYGYRYNVLQEVVKLEQSQLEKCESLEQLRWVENGYRIKTAITEFRTVGVDTPDELIEAEKMLALGEF